MRVTVRINGTSENYYKRWGFTENPFPPIADANPKYIEANRILRLLAAGPITSVEHLREVLAGCSDEFIQLCVDRYRAGKNVTFDVTWPE